MVKKRIIIKGNVQDVGFRVFVKFIARKFKLKGLVRNLPDENVEIFCEGEKKTIDRFVKAISIKSPPDDLEGANVDTVETYEENDAAFKDGKGPMTYREFHVDYSKDQSDSENDELNRQEILIFHGSGLKAEMKGTRTEIQTNRKETRTGLNDLGKQNLKGSIGLGKKVDVAARNVKNMHKDMNVRFTGMERKYHTINMNIEKSNKNIERMTKEISVIAKALLEIVENDIKKNGRRARNSKG